VNDGISLGGMGGWKRMLAVVVIVREEGAGKRNWLARSGLYRVCSVVGKSQRLM